MWQAAGWRWGETSSIPDPGGSTGRVLLSRQAVKFQPMSYVMLAKAYLAALGHGPAGTSFAHITELFHEMDPQTDHEHLYHGAILLATSPNLG